MREMIMFVSVKTDVLTAETPSLFSSTRHVCTAVNGIHNSFVLTFPPTGSIGFTHEHVKTQ